MKKIKDFIYDYNDVLVALLIVAAAGIIIFWRVNAVMDYASYVANEPVKNIDVNFEGIDLKPVDTEDQKDAEVEPERPDDPTPVDPTPTDPTPVDPTPETPGQENTSSQVKTYSFEVFTDKKPKNWTDVGKLLQENGFIDDYRDFVARVTIRKDDRFLKPGKLDVNSNMTVDEIIDILITNRK